MTAERLAEIRRWCDAYDTPYGEERFSFARACKELLKEIDILRTYAGPLCAKCGRPREAHVDPDSFVAGRGLEPPFDDDDHCAAIVRRGLIALGWEYVHPVDDENTDQAVLRPKIRERLVNVGPLPIGSGKPRGA